MNVLFVCTGNIFRSMTAEYCIKDYLQWRGIKDIIVSSAGTVALKEDIHPITDETLTSLGIDASQHVQRKLTKSLIEENDVIIAMAAYHAEYLYKKFKVKPYLFNEICYDEQTSVWDIDDMIPDFRTNPKAVEQHIINTVKYIYKATPFFVKNVRKALD